ncbi:MAG: PEP/pyruvate-binding domain-containing protein [Candidatus Thorarchaeota archaeon]|nr:PEP/pyruvate-binding domain-containing protein [Candidatus Thorarchaeota archaeon]
MENLERLEELTIVPISRISRSDIEMHGGKAANLARLHRMGINVPQGFSVSSSVFTDMVISNPEAQELIKIISDSNDIDAILTYTSDLQKIIENIKIPKGTRSKILGAYRNLRKKSRQEEPNFAIRSSATVEDRDDFSFAGQARSFLCVSKEGDILDCIKGVWASSFTPQAVFYLRDNNVHLSTAKMATVVQEMIPADVSGVMFTANVISKNTDEILLNATWGLGETLVSGQVVPDTYVVGKQNLEVLEQRLGSKKRMCIPETSEKGRHVKIVETPQSKKDMHSLTCKEIKNLAQIGLQIERCFESAQDIEWCLNDSEVAIVQSRPITTI